MSPSATLETSGTTLEAGGAASVPLTVRNDRQVVDEYRFKVVGPLARWATVEPARVSVYPGDSATVTVLFRPPRSWEVLAGNAPYGVQVLPTQYPQDSVVAEGVIRVQPFYETTGDLVPRTSEGRGGGEHRVAVDNRGNVPITVQLVARDPEERLVLELAPASLRIAPGTAQSAVLRVRPQRTMWRGTQTAHPFTVSVEPDGGPGAVLAGTHRQDPVLPGWSPKLIKWLIVLALIGLLIWALVRAVQALREAVPRVITYVQTCAAAIVEGDGLSVCLDVSGDPEEPEARTESFQANAPATQGDVEILEIDEDLAPFRVDAIRVRTTEGDTGLYSLHVLTEPLGPPLLSQRLQSVAGGEQVFNAGFTLEEGQALRLGLNCLTAVDEELIGDEECEVSVDLQGVVVPQGG